MTRAIVPNDFRSNTILEDIDVNENLQAIARDIRRNNDQRYTYSSTIFDVTGLDAAGTSAQRSFTIYMPGRWSGTPTPRDYADLVGIEFDVYDTAGATWTVTVSTGTPTRSIAVTATAAGATTKASATSNAALRWEGQDSLTIMLTGTGVIDAGKVTLHWRADRHRQQSTSRVDYAPSLVDASSAATNTLLNTEFTKAAAGAASDLANSRDLRMEVFAVRDLASVRTWRIPNGAGRTLISAGLGVVPNAIGNAVSFNVNGTALVVTTTTVNQRNGEITSGVTFTDDPTNPANDLVVTLTPTSGTPKVAFVVLFWR